MLDFHVQIEGELEDTVRMAFRDPKRFQINGFGRQVNFVRALIGKTPDDEIWDILKNLVDLRNEYAHGEKLSKVVYRGRAHPC